MSNLWNDFASNTFQEEDCYCFVPFVPPRFSTEELISKDSAS